MGKVIAFSGPSNGGKTTIICKVAKHFIDNGLKVCIIKHDPKNKAKFDTPGKDSFKFQEVGANVVVASPKRTTFFFNEGMEIENIIANLGNFDLLLVEGLKELKLPRISIFKDEIDPSYLPFSQAIASYKNDDFGILNFNLDDVSGICEWILKNAKVV